MGIQSSIVNIMVKSAYKASRKLLRDFGEIENLQSSSVVYNKFANNADAYADSILRAELSKARPSYGIVSEEKEEIIGSDGEHRWIIDPIDGSVNYTHGFPIWSIAIALEKAGEVIASIVYDPVRDEMFWAEKGCGAYVNNRRLKVSGRKNVQESVCLFKDFKDPRLSSFKFHGVRKMGCSTLSFAYVASGRVDAFLISSPINLWDAASGILLVKEAKGVILDKKCNSCRNYCTEMASAANMSLPQYCLEG